jgi:hypothetical protein
LFVQHGTKLSGATTLMLAGITALLGAPLAQGYPGVPLRPAHECYDYSKFSGYQFPRGPLTLVYPGIGETRFDARGGATIDTDAETFYDNGTSMQGRVTGEVVRGALVHLTVTRGKKYPPLQLTGGIDPDNRVRGTYTYRDNLESSPFAMSEELPCVVGPPHDR